MGSLSKEIKKYRAIQYTDNYCKARGEGRTENTKVGERKCEFGHSEKWLIESKMHVEVWQSTKTLDIKHVSKELKKRNVMVCSQKTNNTIKLNIKNGNCAISHCAFSEMVQAFGAMEELLGIFLLNSREQHRW